MTKQLLSPAQVSIFNDDDIDIIFGIFDVTSRGYLDSTQLTKGRSLLAATIVTMMHTCQTIVPNSALITVLPF